MPRPTIRKGRALSLLALLALPFCTGLAGAATYSVTTGADQADGSANGWSLRDAVMASNSDANPSNVITLPAGTYTLSLGPAETNSPSTGGAACVPAAGDIDITKDVEIDGASAATTIIDGGAIDRIFDIHAASVTFRNVTLRNGNSTVVSGLPVGGAVNLRAFNSTFVASGDHELRLENCTLSGNRSAQNGGAIAVYCNMSSSIVPNRLVMNNCTVQSNYAGYGGGGIVLSSSSAAVTGCTFDNNSSNHATLGYGGGAVGSWPGTYASTSFTNCTFSNNSALANGGAIVHHNGAMTVTHCSFSQNSANDFGGAIGRSATSSVAASMTITGCSFDNNHADQDANATGDGGAVYNNGGSSTANVSFCRIVNNTAVNGSGLANAASSGDFTAVNNWWGSNSGATGSMTAGTLTASPHLWLLVSASPASLETGQSATVLASLNTNSNSQVVGGSLPSHVHNSTGVSWGASAGSISPGAPSTLSAGQAQATFVAGSTAGSGSASATIDGQTVSVTIPITQPDVTAPSSTASMADNTLAGVTQADVSFSASDTGGSGLASTRLRVKTPGSSSYVDSGLAPLTAASGTFHYPLTSGSGVYQFSTLSVDGQGNSEAEPATPDVTLIYNSVENAPLTLQASATNETLVFPMTNSLNVSLELSGAQVGGSVSVSRATGPAFSAPAYFRLPGRLLGESLNITGSGLGGGCVATLHWNFDAANATGLTPEFPLNTVYRFDGAASPSQIFNTVTVSGNTVSVSGIGGFSQWYAGNSTAFPVSMSAWSAE